MVVQHPAVDARVGVIAATCAPGLLVPVERYCGIVPPGAVIRGADFQAFGVAERIGGLQPAVHVLIPAQARIEVLHQPVRKVVVPYGVVKQVTKSPSYVNCEVMPMTSVILMSRPCAS